MRQASVLVADEVTFSLNGKLNIIGLYTGDIIIPNISVFLNQLIFVFIIETEPTEPFRELKVQVTLPSGQHIENIVNIETLNPTVSDSIKWTTRFPVAFYGAVLTAGSIVAKVIHEKGELIAAAPVIVSPVGHFASPGIPDLR